MVDKKEIFTELENVVLEIIFIIDYDIYKEIKEELIEGEGSYEINAISNVIKNVVAASALDSEYRKSILEGENE